MDPFLKTYFEIFRSQVELVKKQPALQKISTENFRNIISQQADGKDLVIVFAEENVSLSNHLQIALK
jgi:hypothetical protein